MSSHVITEPRIEIDPNLGDLEWVKGSFPTPYGILKIEHQKQLDGSIKTTFEKPDGIVVSLVNKRK